MGTGWRRAFCTTIPREQREQQQQQKRGGSSSSPSLSPSPSPRSCVKIGFFSNPSTPRLRSQSVNIPTSKAQATANPSADTESPSLQCKTTKSTKSPRPVSSSNPSSPRSPLKLSLFRNSFKFRSSCGICLNSVKTGQGTAIYTAECGHAFHFPCVTAHVGKHNSLVCPVCNATWKDVPLLAIRHSNNQSDVVSPTTSTNNNNKPKVEDKKVLIVEHSPRLTTKPSDLSRSYDDDEPLLSPTTGSRFVPIPEADEDADEDDDVQEFQGFFVNQNLKSDVRATNIDSRAVQVKLLPESAVISSTRGYETYAVRLRVKAPPPRGEASHRAPIDLVAVLDVSGSMTGPKLQMLKRAMRLVISSLGSADRLSIVAFSTAPKRLMPLKRMTVLGQRAARRIVDRLVCGQGSSMGDALRKATKVLEDRRERNPVASIMLLSNGQDERACSKSRNQRQGSSHVSSTRFAHIEIPVHSFGFGQSGGYSHEAAEDAFAKCVGGLLSVVVQDVRIQLGFASGSAPADVLAVYSCNTRPTALGSGSIRLGDLYAEEERELLVELRVPSGSIGSHHVLSVKCCYKDPANQEVVYCPDQALLVPRPQAVRSSDPKIERLKSLFVTTRAIAEARRLIENTNDLNSAHHLLASSRALLLQSGLSSNDEFVRGLEAELAEVHWKRQQQMMTLIGRRNEREPKLGIEYENIEDLTPTSAWRAAEKLAKVAMMKKSMNRVGDLHGFENARF